jgi:hypothetical protein
VAAGEAIIRLDRESSVDSGLTLIVAIPMTLQRMDRMRVIHWAPLLGVLLLAACVAAPEPQMSPLTASPSAANVDKGTVQPLTQGVPSAAAALQPNPDKAVLVGQVLSSRETGSKPLAGIAVRLARVYWNADKSDGAFVLEGATSPSTIAKDDGGFVLADVAPADYVIVIGDPETENSILLEPDGRARVITLQAGKKLDLGRLETRSKLR